MQTIESTSKQVIKGISSMATRQLLADLVTAYTLRTGQVVEIESVGGVDAAKRVLAGEAFDLVVLASDAIEKLINADHLDELSKVDLVHSGVAVAVRRGAVPPDISSEAAVRESVLAAPTISYSTGPSGVALAKLFERWGITELIAERIVQAPPGIPVGALVARGDVALGFQQLSELIHVEGITIVGELPSEIQITTTFSAAMSTGLGSNPRHAAQVHGFLEYLASEQTAQAKRKQGMLPA